MTSAPGSSGKWQLQEGQEEAPLAITIPPRRVRRPQSLPTTGEVDSASERPAGASSAARERPAGASSAADEAAPGVGSRAAQDPAAPSNSGPAAPSGSQTRLHPPVAATSPASSARAPSPREGQDLFDLQVLLSGSSTGTSVHGFSSPSSNRNKLWPSTAQESPRRAGPKAPAASRDQVLPSPDSAGAPGALIPASSSGSWFELSPSQLVPLGSARSTEPQPRAAALHDPPDQAVQVSGTQQSVQQGGMDGSRLEGQRSQLGGGASPHISPCSSGLQSSAPASSAWVPLSKDPMPPVHEPTAHSPASSSEGTAQSTPPEPSPHAGAMMQSVSQLINVSVESLLFDIGDEEQQPGSGQRNPRGGARSAGVGGHDSTGGNQAGRGAEPLPAPTKPSAVALDTLRVAGDRIAGAPHEVTGSLEPMSGEGGQAEGELRGQWSMPHVSMPRTSSSTMLAQQHGPEPLPAVAAALARGQGASGGSSSTLEAGLARFLEESVQLATEQSLQPQHLGKTGETSKQEGGGARGGRIGIVEPGRHLVLADSAAALGHGGPGAPVSLSESRTAGSAMNPVDSFCGAECLHARQAGHLQEFQAGMMKAADGTARRMKARAVYHGAVEGAPQGPGAPAQDVEGAAADELEDALSHLESASWHSALTALNGPSTDAASFRTAHRSISGSHTWTGSVKESEGGPSSPALNELNDWFANDSSLRSAWSGSGAPNPDSPAAFRPEAAAGAAHARFVSAAASPGGSSLHSGASRHKGLAPQTARRSVTLPHGALGPHNAWAPFPEGTAAARRAPAETPRAGGSALLHTKEKNRSCPAFGGASPAPAREEPPTVPELQSAIMAHDATAGRPARNEGRLPSAPAAPPQEVGPAESLRVHQTAQGALFMPRQHWLVVPGGGKECLRDAAPEIPPDAAHPALAPAAATAAGARGDGAGSHARAGSTDVGEETRAGAAGGPPELAAPPPISDKAMHDGRLGAAQDGAVAADVVEGGPGQASIRAASADQKIDAEAGGHVPDSDWFLVTQKREDTLSSRIVQLVRSSMKRQLKTRAPQAGDGRVLPPQHAAQPEQHHAHAEVLQAHSQGSPTAGNPGHDAASIESVPDDGGEQEYSWQRGQRDAALLVQDVGFRRGPFMSFSQEFVKGSAVVPHSLSLEGSGSPRSAQHTPANDPQPSGRRGALRLPPLSPFRMRPGKKTDHGMDGRDQAQDPKERPPRTAWAWSARASRAGGTLGRSASKAGPLPQGRKAPQQESWSWAARGAPKRGHSEESERGGALDEPRSRVHGPLYKGKSSSPASSQQEARQLRFKSFSQEFPLGSSTYLRGRASHERTPDWTPELGPISGASTQEAPTGGGGRGATEEGRTGYGVVLEVSEEALSGSFVSLLTHQTTHLQHLGVSQISGSEGCAPPAFPSPNTLRAAAPRALTVSVEAATESASRAPENAVARPRDGLCSPTSIRGSGTFVPDLNSKEQPRAEIPRAGTKLAPFPRTRDVPDINSFVLRHRMSQEARAASARPAPSAGVAPGSNGSGPGSLQADLANSATAGAIGRYSWGVAGPTNPDGSSPHRLRNDQLAAGVSLTRSQSARFFMGSPGVGPWQPSPTTAFTAGEALAADRVRETQSGRFVRARSLSIDGHSLPATRRQSQDLSSPSTRIHLPARAPQPSHTRSRSLVFFGRARGRMSSPVSSPGPASPVPGRTVPITWSLEWPAPARLRGPDSEPKRTGPAALSPGTDGASTADEAAKTAQPAKRGSPSRKLQPEAAGGSGSRESSSEKRGGQGPQMPGSAAARSLAPRSVRGMTSRSGKAGATATGVARYPIAEDQDMQEGGDEVEPKRRKPRNLGGKRVMAAGALLGMDPIGQAPEF